MSRIEKLTPAQLAELPAYRDKWIRIGFCTESARRADAENGVRAAYAEAGLKPPRFFVWFGSPFTAAIAVAVLRNPKLVSDQVIAQVRAQVSEMFWWLWGMWGSFDAAWLSYYDVFDNVLGLQCCKRLAGLKQIAESCGFWWPLEDICVMSERPMQIHRDASGRLHCDSELAVKYPDGWGVPAWHGVRVPEDMILAPQSITVERIEKESNVEVRRVMMERMGYERYILESGATLIHSDEYGALYRKEFGDDEPLVVVHVTNSTAEPDGHFKKYVLRVPPTMERARQAVAWTFDVPEQDYAPLVET